MRRASFGSFRKGLRTLRSLSWADRGLLAEATLRLATARLALLFLPFSFLSPRLGVPMKETGEDTTDYMLLRRVAWAVGAVSRRAPWRCKCLEQGIAAKMMLRRRRVTNTLYLGVARGDRQLDAHAWLRSGTVYVTGGADHERFSVVSTFADEARD
jgi:hypothetical protein